MRPGKELYDLRQDPDCLHNRAAHPESAARRAALQDALFAKLKQEGDPRVFGQGDVFSQYPHASPGHVNFHGRFLHGELVQHVLAMAGREACVTGQVRRPALPETSIRT